MAGASSAPRTGFALALFAALLVIGVAGALDADSLIGMAGRLVTLGIAGLIGVIIYEAVVIDSADRQEVTSRRSQGESRSPSHGATATPIGPHDDYEVTEDGGMAGVYIQDPPSKRTPNAKPNPECGGNQVPPFGGVADVHTRLRRGSSDSASTDDHTELYVVSRYGTVERLTDVLGGHSKAAHPFDSSHREPDGQFGSMPLHDDYSDDGSSPPDDNEQ